MMPTTSQRTELLRSCGNTRITFQRSTEADMTARNGTAEWHGSVESGSGTITVGDGLSAAGHPPRSLRTSARVQLRNHGSAITLARMDLETEGDVPDIDEREFHACAEAAKRDCPVSQALAGIPEITLATKLRIAGSTRVTAESDR
jgi:hypothetical protein